LKININLDIFSLISEFLKSKVKHSVSDLDCGETAVITSVGDNCIDINCHCLRLLEIGFTPGQEVTIVAKSPFKDPLAVSIRGTIIALRKNEAECIKI
jgi:Fe2+ transport system protein FeoA